MCPVPSRPPSWPTSPRGDVSVRWERTPGQVFLTVSVPKGVRADIRLGAAKKVLPGGGKAQLSIAS